MSYINGLGATDGGFNISAEQIEAGTKAAGMFFDFFTGMIKPPPPRATPVPAQVYVPPPPPPPSPLVSRNVLLAGGAAVALIGVVALIARKKRK